MRRSVLRDNLTAFMFLSPFIVIFAVFLAYPLIYSFYLSLNKVTTLVNVFENLRFVGLENFIALAKDGLFGWSLLMTGYYAALMVPLGIASSLILAVLLNNKLKLHGLFRTAFFLPYVLDLFVVAIVWTFIYSPHYGVLTRILEKLSIHYFSEQGFLGRPGTAMPAVVLVNVLKGAGFGMVLYLAALENIPASIYEAAEVDGATWWQKLTRITFPLLKPITLFLVIVGVVSALNAFVEVYAMTSGGPSVNVAGKAYGATWVTGYYLFDTFYVKLKLGYAAAMSYVLLAVAVVVSLVNIRVLRPRGEY
ncbi:MAG TPA: sugar ABC transporter permease [bacterium]|nr:sugar ABC transporter permease [bacterium]